MSSPPRRLTLYTDGAADPNPGPGSIGAALIDESGRVVKRISRPIGQTTNNRAEYQALIAGLEAAAESGAEHIEIRSDSELMIKQIQGGYKVRSRELKPLRERALQLLGRFQSYSIAHIPGEQNKQAHYLCQQALRHYR